MSLQEIPLVNIDKKGYEKLFVESLKEFGCVEFCGKEIKQIKELAFEIKKDFSNFSHLPQKTKMKYHLPETRGSYGFFPLKKEDPEFNNFSETYTVCGKVPKDHPLKIFNSLNLYLDNAKIKEFPELVPKSEKLLYLLEQLEVRLLEEISTKLGIGKNYFPKNLVYGTSFLRLLYYPKVKKESQRISLSEHKDRTIFTYFLDIEEGSRIKIKGKYQNYVSNKNSIVLQLGKMTQYLVAGKIPSLDHYVDKELNKERISVVVFKHFKPSNKVGVLSPFRKNINLKGFPIVSFYELFYRIMYKGGVIQKKVFEKKRDEINEFGTEEEMNEKILYWEKEKGINRLSKYF